MTEEMSRAAAEISDEMLQRLRLPQPEHAAFVRDAIFGMMAGALVVPQIDGCDMLTGRKVDFALKVAMAKVRKFRMTKFIQKAGIAPSTATILAQFLHNLRRDKAEETGFDFSFIPPTSMKTVMQWIREAVVARDEARRTGIVLFDEDSTPEDLLAAAPVGPAAAALLQQGVIAVAGEVPPEGLPQGEADSQASKAIPPKSYAEAVQDLPAPIDPPTYARRAYSDDPCSFHAATAKYVDAGSQPHAVAWTIKMAAEWTAEGLANACSGWRGAVLKAAPYVVVVQRAAVTWVLCPPRTAKKKDPRFVFSTVDVVAPVRPADPEAAAIFDEFNTTTHIETYFVADVRTASDGICDPWTKDGIVFGISKKKKALAIAKSTFVAKRAAWEVSFPPAVSIGSIFKIALQMGPDVISDQYGHIFGWQPLTDAMRALVQGKGKIFTHTPKGRAAAGSDGKGAAAEAEADPIVEVVMSRGDKGALTEKELGDVVQKVLKIPFVKTRYGIHHAIIVCRRSVAVAVPQQVLHWVFELPRCHDPILHPPRSDANKDPGGPILHHPSTAPPPEEDAAQASSAAPVGRD